MKKLVFLFFICATKLITAQHPSYPEDLIIERIIQPNGDVLVREVVPGRPPGNFRMPISIPESGSVIIPGVPAYDWAFGCAPTSAAMLAAYYDRNGYPNMYGGRTNDGIAPMTNEIWGSVIINGETRKQCPISATRLGLDGRDLRGHVDNYWVKYNSTAPDPYIVNGWPQHEWGECVADFMKTNQSAFNNEDGSTYFWWYLSGAANHGLINIDTDGIRGIRLFLEARGYAVKRAFTQLIQGYGGNTLGFTFDQYKQEIDAGRPVIIGVIGHIMLGVGYSTTSSKIYLYDTWDYELHEMNWGGSYQQMQHRMVGVIELVKFNFSAPQNLVATSTGNSVSLSWQAPPQNRPVQNQPAEQHNLNALPDEIISLIQSTHEANVSGAPTVNSGNHFNLKIKSITQCPDAQTLLAHEDTTPSQHRLFEVMGNSKPLMASGNMLYNNGPLVNSPGTGVGGADESILQTRLGMTLLGSSVNRAANWSIADDFVVNATWNIASFDFFIYQTGSSTSSTITGAYVQIWNGRPGAGGSVIWGNFTTNRMASTAWAGIYRHNQEPLGPVDRPVMRVTAQTTGLNLPPGNYWVHCTFTGSLASGPWQPPITINGLKTTGNALQFNGTTWSNWNDSGSNTQQGMPFIINGSSSNPPQQPIPTGYNIYRNGILQTSIEPPETSYTDTQVIPGQYTYGVSATYAFPYVGESSKTETAINVEITCKTCPEYDHAVNPTLVWQTQSSSISPSGCKIYRVDITRGHKYIFKTGCGNQATASFNTLLELNSSNCNMIASNDDGCENLRSKIEWTANTTGYAYLIVKGSGTASGNYVLAYKQTFPGDANCDGVVNVLDVINTVNFIMGGNPSPFCLENADVNSDSTINVLDVIGTVNIIMAGM